ncbi:MAG: class II fructose-bisphosphate aldolase [Gammaproteobacteria bacterium]|nr:class II fructose-bisphosphate aldolase [Gammaproteobacteria bacterium]
MSDQSSGWSLLSPLLIVIGWSIVLTNASRYARRSEIRGLCNDVDSLATEISAETKDFWLKKYEECSSSEVRHYIYHTENAIERLDKKLELLQARSQYSIGKSVEIIEKLHDKTTMDAERVKELQEERRVRVALQVDHDVAMCISAVEELFDSVAGEGFFQFAWRKLLTKCDGVGLCKKISDIYKMRLLPHLQRYAENFSRP